MVFSSLIFVTLFLPCFLALYYLCPARWRNLIILMGSYAFYSWWRLDFAILFATVTLFNYGISLRMLACRRQAQHPKAKIWLSLGIALNLLVLGYFKYFNFGAESMNTLLLALGTAPWEAWQVILPIGISFYIFQAMSYLIDLHREDAPPAPNLLNFAAYLSLFPQLIAGPILRYKDIAAQFQHRHHSLRGFNEGAIYFMSGFCKKVLIADSVAPLADGLFALQNPNFAESWLAALAFTVQLFFDFCGYSQMAVGLSLMMGFRLVRNFDHPYISRSITEFWRRWHISLSSWLRDYLYIPLGGNRGGRRRTYLNLFLTILLGGLWHGANVTFLLWGMWHGLWLMVERAMGAKNHTPYPPLLGWALTFLAVILGWVMFKADSPHHALAFYAGMVDASSGLALRDSLSWQWSLQPFTTLIIGLTLCFISPLYLKTRGHHQTDITESWAQKWSVLEQFAVIILFLIALSKLVAQSHSPFLYFQF